VKVDYDSVGVDTPEDVAKVEKILATDETRIEHRFLNSKNYEH
jgi:hypothetical protein